MKKNERQNSDKNESFKKKIEVRQINTSKGIIQKKRNDELNNRQKEGNQLELMFLVMLRLYKDREKKREQEVKERSDLIKQEKIDGTIRSGV